MTVIDCCVTASLCAQVADHVYTIRYGNAAD